MNKLNLTDKILLNALYEDIGSGDITTSALVPEGHVSIAEIIAKEALVLAGLPFAERAFKLTDCSIKFRSLKKTEAG
jgi:nicotinate-nucleotide pyrophosphorylase (carboxylating)